MDRAEATTRLLDTAGTLFYERGVQAVGMDEIRANSGVSLKRLYQCFPSKEDLVAAYLRRRDQWWRSSLTGFVTAQRAAPATRPLLIFDWLHDWFAEPGFRGCAFINSFGELGASSTEVADIAREHKAALRDYVLGLLHDTPLKNPAAAADQLLLLVDGAIVSAAITGDPRAAQSARTAAEELLKNP